MIKLTKAQAPPELIAKLEAWKQRLLELTASGEKVPDSLRAAYRDEAVKDLAKKGKRMKNVCIVKARSATFILAM